MQIPRPRVSFPTLQIPPLPKTQALSSTTFKPPPLDGSLSLPEIYDWHYTHTPSHPIFVYPDGLGGVKTVLWPEAVRAVHTGARIVQAKLGISTPSSERHPVVAIFASSDTITYFTVIAAICRAGCAAFLVSPRNSSTAVAHLLAQTDTKHILVGHETALRNTLETALKIMHEERLVSVLPQFSHIPTYADMYLEDDGQFELLPPFHPTLDSLAVVLHSSGSTAFPKPIPWSHISLMQIGYVPYFGEKDMTGVRFSCHAMPMYHGMGMMQTGWTATAGLTLTAAKPQTPALAATPENVFSGLVETQSDIVFCVPSFIENWAQNPAYVSRLTQTDGLLFGGGPLNKKVGDALTREGISIYILYGCSEIGIMSPILPLSSSLDWEYFELSSQMKGVYVPNGFGQAELAIVPNPYEMPCVINGTVGGEDCYYTSDLFSPHPTKPGYWKVFGRCDDQIMHNTGEKTNPGPLENILNQDPRVLSSVMFGTGRFNAGVIIDPRPEYKFDPNDTEKLSQFRTDIWPSVTRLNEYAPQHSRLFKEMIVVASPDKPLQYTAKNTARRQVIIKEYEAEIEALYRTVEETTQTQIGSPTKWSLSSIRLFVRNVVKNVIQYKQLADDQDFFQYGCDSLQATWIRNTLFRCLRDAASVNTNLVSHSIVYEHPTIESLASHVFHIGSRSSAHTASMTPEAKLRDMDDMVKKYTQGLQVATPVPSTKEAMPEKDVLLVTGTTGALGAAFLAQLVGTHSVSRVYAVNRRVHGSLSLGERQLKAFEKQGLPCGIQSEKLVLIETNMDEADLGLTSALLDQIRASVTHIVHIAWRVDFNLSLSSFEANVRTVRMLVDLALSSTLPVLPRLTFTSTIGVLRNVAGTGPVPEDFTDSSSAIGSGYSQSKWVSEAILHRVSQETRLRPIIVRVGQISGAMNGYWNETDWVPSMIKSGRTLGCFPQMSQVITWIPLDEAARVLVEMCNADSPILHLVHPNPVGWSVVADAVSKVLDTPLVTYQEWLALLQARAHLSEDTDSGLPAAKILPFFQADNLDITVEVMGFPNLDITAACKASPTLSSRTVRVIDSEDVVRWIENWRRRGFLA